jgi:hypothetical protein
MDRRLIGHKIFWKFLVLARIRQSYDFGFLPRCREVTESKIVIS